MLRHDEETINLNQIQCHMSNFNARYLALSEQLSEPCLEQARFNHKLIVEAEFSTWRSPELADPSSLRGADEFALRTSADTNESPRKEKRGRRNPRIVTATTTSGARRACMAQAKCSGQAEHEECWVLPAPVALRPRYESRGLSKSKGVRWRKLTPSSPAACIVSASVSIADSKECFRPRPRVLWSRGLTVPGLPLEINTENQKTAFFFVVCESCQSCWFPIY